jgi:hypothetical protein
VEMGVPSCAVVRMRLKGTYACKTAAPNKRMQLTKRGL